MSLANKLTMLRVVLIAPFIAAMYIPHPAAVITAAVIFTVAAVTDVLDGYVARRQGTVSAFGKIMDPIADKMLVMAALVILVQWGSAPAWAVMVIIGREFLVSGIRMMVLEKGGNVIAASWLGKLKTILQDIAVICLIMQNILPFLQNWYISMGVLFLSVFFTLWSAVDYTVSALPILRQGE